MLLTDSVAFRFRLESLAILEKCVRRLAEDGGIFKKSSTKLWSDVLDDAPSSLEAIETSLEKTRIRVDRVQILKSLSKGLGRLKDNLDNFIEARCEEILRVTRHHGLASLPDDILQAIFEQLLESYGNPFPGSQDIIRDLSLVSRRFRGNILAFAKAWTYLDVNACGTESFPLFLERSGNRLINVGFVLYAGIKEKILSALSFGDRWGSLWVHLAEASEEEFGLLPFLSLPAVKRLDISARPECSGSVPWTSPGWSFPNVEQVHIRDDIPNPESFPYESLKSLTYTVAHHHNPPTCDNAFLTRFANFLRPAIALRILHLDVSFRSSVVHGWVQMEPSNVVELPSVEIFSISNFTSKMSSYYSLHGSSESYWHDDDHSDYFIEIARIFNLPNVQDIRVELKYSGDLLPERNWLDLAFPYSKGSKSVIALTFNVFRSRGGGGDKLDLRAFFEFFPALQSLSLDARVIDCNICLGDPGDDPCQWACHLGSLESFQIKFTSISSGTAEIHNLLRTMVGLGAPLKKIDIYSLYAFNVETLEEMVPGAKIHSTITY